MPSFKYKAKDSKSGNIVEGTLEASDSRGAAGQIREMGYWPIDIKQVAGPKTASMSAGAGLGPLWTGVSVRSLAIFFRQLSTMLHAGMSMGEALDTIAKQKGMGKLRVIAVKAADHVRSGGMLSDIMSANPFIFAPMHVSLVRMGETGGLMDAMIDRIASYSEREVVLRQKFSKITLYPKIVLVFIIAAWLFIPKVKEIMAGGWPVIFDILSHQFLPVAGLLVLIYIVLRLLLSLPPARLGWDWMKLMIPGFGGVVRKLSMARFSLTMSLGYSAGLSLGNAVELSADAVGNEALRKSIKSTVPEIRAGGQLSDALRRTGCAQELVLGMLMTGEKTGSIDTVLDKVSEYYTGEAETSIDKFGVLLFVTLILIFAVIVFIIVKNFYIGSFNDTMKQAGQ